MSFFNESSPWYCMNYQENLLPLSDISFQLNQCDKRKAYQHDLSLTGNYCEINYPSLHSERSNKFAEGDEPFDPIYSPRENRSALKAADQPQVDNNTFAQSQARTSAAVPTTIRPSTVATRNGLIPTTRHRDNTATDLHSYDTDFDYDLHPTKLTPQEDESVRLQREVSGCAQSTDPWTKLQEEKTCKIWESTWESHSSAPSRNCSHVSDSGFFALPLPCCSSQTKGTVQDTWLYDERLPTFIDNSLDQLNSLSSEQLTHDQKFLTYDMPQCMERSQIMDSDSSVKANPFKSHGSGFLLGVSPYCNLKDTIKPYENVYPMNSDIITPDDSFMSFLLRDKTQDGCTTRRTSQESVQAIPDSSPSTSPYECEKYAADLNVSASSETTDNTTYRVKDAKSRLKLLCYGPGRNCVLGTEQNQHNSLLFPDLNESIDTVHLDSYISSCSNTPHPTKVLGPLYSEAPSQAETKPYTVHDAKQPEALDSIQNITIQSKCGADPEYCADDHLYYEGPQFGYSGGPREKQASGDSAPVPYDASKGNTNHPKMENLVGMDAQSQSLDLFPSSSSLYAGPVISGIGVSRDPDMSGDATLFLSPPTPTAPSMLETTTLSPHSQSFLGNHLTANEFFVANKNQGDNIMEDVTNNPTFVDMETGAPTCVTSNTRMVHTPIKYNLPNLWYDFKSASCWRGKPPNYVNSMDTCSTSYLLEDSCKVQASSSSFQPSKNSVIGDPEPPAFGPAEMAQHSYSNATLTNLDEYVTEYGGHPDSTVYNSASGDPFLENTKSTSDIALQGHIDYGTYSKNGVPLDAHKGLLFSNQCQTTVTTSSFPHSTKLPVSHLRECREDVCNIFCTSREGSLIDHCITTVAFSCVCCILVSLHWILWVTQQWYLWKCKQDMENCHDMDNTVKNFKRWDTSVSFSGHDTVGMDASKKVYMKDLAEDTMNEHSPFPTKDNRIFLLSHWKDAINSWLCVLGKQGLKKELNADRYTSLRNVELLGVFFSQFGRIISQNLLEFSKTLAELICKNNLWLMEKAMENFDEAYKRDVSTASEASVPIKHQACSLATTSPFPLESSSCYFCVWGKPGPMPYTNAILGEDTIVYLLKNVNQLCCWFKDTLSDTIVPSTTVLNQGNSDSLLNPTMLEELVLQDPRGMDGHQDLDKNRFPLPLDSCLFPPSCPSTSAPLISMNTFMPDGNKNKSETSPSEVWNEKPFATKANRYLTKCIMTGVNKKSKKWPETHNKPSGNQDALSSDHFNDAQLNTTATKIFYPSKPTSCGTGFATKVLPSLGSLQSISTAPPHPLASFDKSGLTDPDNKKLLLLNKDKNVRSMNQWSEYSLSASRPIRGSCNYYSSSMMHGTEKPKSTRRKRCKSPVNMDAEDNCHTVKRSYEDPKATQGKRRPQSTGHDINEEKTKENPNDVMLMKPNSGFQKRSCAPGLYFDRRRRGFRIRFQNIYVGWVSLSRYASYEQAYLTAKMIWDNAVHEATAHQNRQAALHAGIPLQIQHRLHVRNPGGRPRTVSRLSPLINAEILVAVNTAKRSKTNH